MFKEVADFIREQFNTDQFIPLHEPRFVGNEKKYLTECIDSTFVSSVGIFVDKFEEVMKEKTGAKYAVATVNGTESLHIALITAGVKPGDEVITQPLTFVATANAIQYTGGSPIFVDVDKNTLGMSPIALKAFLEKNVNIVAGIAVNKVSGKKIAACVPMHTFGFPCAIDEIVAICDEYAINVVEDSAEALGSYYKGKHTGTFGKLGIFSFNGNKTITCGGGGCIVTDDEALAKRAKHITTTAKVPHKWEYVHNEIGFNYRLPNLNAALACAQLEQLDSFIDNKRELAVIYTDYFKSKENIDFVVENDNSKANYWLMTVLLEDRAAREKFLEDTNGRAVMTRPAWRLMNKLEMYKDAQCGDLSISEWLEDRVVNIPSSVRIN